MLYVPQLSTLYKFLCSVCFHGNPSALHHLHYMATMPKVDNTLTARMLAYYVAILANIMNRALKIDFACLKLLNSDLPR